MTPAPAGRGSIPALLDAAAGFGDRLAIDDGASRLTYPELVEVSRTFGASLVAAGIEPGDRVAVWAPNSARWVIALLGLSQAGAVLVPINTRFKGHEAVDLIARSRARALVTVNGFLDTDYVDLLRSTGVALDDLETIVVADGDAPPGSVPWDEFLGRSDRHLGEVDARRAAVRGSDISDILFTSGTTGAPKGVVMTHDRTVAVATDWVAMTGLTTDDRYLMVNPFFHMFGLKAGILAGLAAGATMFPQAVFDVDAVLARIEAERVTVLPGPPTLYQAMLDQPGRDAFDLSTLRVAVTGAADIPVELIRRLHTELPFSVIITGYGLTEAGTATSTSPGDDVEVIATTVGRPRPGFELRLVDERDIDVPVGQPGEILLRASSIMASYLDDPAATAAVLTPEGWLRTGDLGTMDQDDHLRIVGRTKDMFVVGGFNAYPAEIENALLGHPAVRQAAVIGVPDERLGEVGMAFVVAASSSLSDSELISWCRERIANYKVPRGVRFVDELPLNATGKVHKEALRAQVSGPTAGGS